MTTRIAVSTPAASAPLPVFSQAVKSRGMVYVSGNIGLDPVSSKLVEGGIKAQTEEAQSATDASGETDKAHIQAKAIDNIAAVLEAAGSDLGRVQKVNVYIKTFADFAPMNEVYMERFADPKPARTCVAVADLPFGAIVEMECVAEY